MLSTGAELTPALREFCGAVGYDLHLGGKFHINSFSSHSYSLSGPRKYWFCSSTSHMATATQFWKVNGGGIFDEDHSPREVSIHELSTTSFPIYVVEQKPGELVVTPSMSVYQCMSLVCALLRKCHGINFL